MVEGRAKANLTSKEIQHKELPLVNWKACKAHRSAASLTGVLPSFKHSASAGPNAGTRFIMAKGFACHSNCCN